MLFATLVVYYPLFIFGLDQSKAGTLPPYSVWIGNGVLMAIGISCCTACEDNRHCRRLVGGQLVEPHRLGEPIKDAGVESKLLSDLYHLEFSLHPASLSAHDVKHGEINRPFRCSRHECRGYS